MNNYIIKFAAAALVLSSLNACSDEQLLAEGEGKVKISARLNSDVTVVSRAQSDEELNESCTVWISNSKGVVREYHGLNSVPADGISLYSGNYKAEAWAGTKSAASFDDRWFEGSCDFTVSKGATTQVELECKIQNTVASVLYDEAVKDVISEYSMTVGTTAGKLTFEGDDQRKAYYIMPEGETDLTYTLNAKLSTGEEYSRKGVIENAKAATEYRINVRYTGENEEIGGAYISIEVDESEIVCEEEILITVAPDIQGYGFDINKPQRAKAHEVGRKSLYIAACAALKSVILEGDVLKEQLGLEGNDIDLLNYADDIRDKVIAGGINFTYSYDEANDVSGMKINFEEDFCNKLTDGEYTININATDALGKSAGKQLTLVISDDPVTTAEANPGEVYASHAIVRANLSSDAANYGFKYRILNNGDWTFVPGIAVGDSYYSELAGLTPGTSYEYMAVSDNFESPRIMTFTTESALQLPNASFERSGMDGKAIVFYGDGEEMFWDSGNHGSAKMNKNVTVQSTDFAHDGNYSLKLESQFVGLGIIGEFAAGNIFVGKFLGTEDTTKGILGWGREFTSRPKELKAWVKYTPGTVEHHKGGDLNNGDADEGIIYIALVDNSTEKYGNYDPWPCIVATKQPKLFDKNGKNVIAYGEHCFKGATNGDGLVEITIPLDYKLTDIKPSNIILTASASRCGDYYTGGNSVMYIDDIQLIY